MHQFKVTETVGLADEFVDKSGRRGSGALNKDSARGGYQLDGFSGRQKRVSHRTSVFRGDGVNGEITEMTEITLG
jgi:hypothetical protein